MSLDLTPRPSVAPAWKRVWSQGRLEARLQVRNGEQLLLSLVIPVAALVIGRFALDGWVDFAELAPSVLVLALWSSGFTATAIATGFDRKYGVLERLATTPLQRSGLIGGKAVGVTLIAAGQLVVLTVLALILGWRPLGGPATAVVVTVTSLAAMTTFVAAALLLAGRLRGEVTLALANVLYLALAAGGGILIAPDRFGDPFTTLVRLLPTGALGDAWRSFSLGFGEPAWSALWLPILVSVVWASVMTFLSSKGFRWLG